MTKIELKSIVKKDGTITLNLPSELQNYEVNVIITPLVKQEVINQFYYDITVKESDKIIEEILTEIGDYLPQLSDYALTRDSFYEGSF